jgi:UDP-N-acetylmuramate dehydrogenase
MRWPDDWAGSIRREISLRRLTTLGVGGRAAYAFFPRDDGDLKAALRFCRDEGLPVRVLGDGSNVLVSSRRFPGAVVCTRALKGLRIEGGRVVAAAGESLIRTIAWTHRNDRVGLETLVGIPGSVGGSVRMNAGGKHGCIGDHVHAVHGVRVLTGEDVVRDAAACGFGYRTSSLGDLVVTRVVFALPTGDGKAARIRARSMLDEKRRTQPLRSRTAGCVFKNPPGDSAGRLIEEAGLKGLRCGGARVSPRHANFIVTGPDARADDVGGLIRTVRRRVSERFGITLELEIDVWS